MLYKVENKYVEKVVSMIKDIVDKNSRRVEEKIKAGLADDIEFEIVPNLFVNAKVKMLPDETPEKTPDGKIAFSMFRVEGNMVHFLAFCFQEGELQYQSDCQTCKKRGRCIHKTPNYYFSHSTMPSNPDISEWRNYMERKYQIFIPALDFDDSNECELCTNFAHFLYNYKIQVTGGIICSNCLKS